MHSKIDCSSKSEAGIIGVYLLGHHQGRNECGQSENQFSTLLGISTIKITYITR